MVYLGPVAPFTCPNGVRCPHDIDNHRYDGRVWSCVHDDCYPPERGSELMSDHIELEPRDWELEGNPDDPGPELSGPPVEFNVGDTVRVTFEGQITDVYSDVQVVAVRPTSGTNLIMTSHQKFLTMVKRAHDPANDPVGTVRRTLRGEILVNHEPDNDEDDVTWHSLGGEWFGHHEVKQDWVIVGVVPGSPADLARQERNDAQKEA